MGGLIFVLVIGAAVLFVPVFIGVDWTVLTMPVISAVNTHRDEVSDGARWRAAEDARR